MTPWGHLGDGVSGSFILYSKKNPARNWLEIFFINLLEAFPTRHITEVVFQFYHRQ